MDRDAAPAAGSSVEVVPPLPWASARKVGLIGLGLVAGAALLGLIATVADVPPGPLHSARLVLVLVGAVTAGAAVSMRPDLWQTWLIGAGAALLAIPGTPAHWDSFRLLFGALTAVAVVWALVLLAPREYRLPVLSAVVVFHFSGIFFATTSPPSTPWVTEQAFMRVYNPYLQLIYMRNAYHFYSPEPGPASVLVCLLKTETGTDANGRKQYQTRWVVLPKRPADVRDPLGLTYYRRLSLTEQLARVTPGLMLQANEAERKELLIRRQTVAQVIPLDPREKDEFQYRLPQPEVARFVLPSYASHVILDHTDAATAGKTTVKVYRMEHRTLSVEEFTNALGKPGTLVSPYHPTTYKPYFLGEFGYVPDPDKPGATRIELLNPQEPMLYWLVPVLPRPGGVPPGDPNKRDFVDFLSIHALDTLNLSVDEVDDPKYRDRVFDWSQLR